MPGDFGDVVPKRPSLHVAEMEVRGKPDFRLRNWWGTTSPESNLAEYRWKLRNGLNPTANLIANPLSHTGGLLRLLIGLYVGRPLVLLRKFDPPLES